MKKKDPFLDPENPTRFISDEDPVWKKVKKEMEEKRDPNNYYHQEYLKSLKQKEWEDDKKKEKIPFESYLAVIIVIIMFIGYIWLYVYSSKQ